MDLGRSRANTNQIFCDIIKMRNIIFLLFILKTAIGQSQELKDVFLSIPDKTINISVNDRIKMWKEYNGKSQHLKDKEIEKIDFKNGYLKYFANGGDEDGEMAMWNIPNEKYKIIIYVQNYSATFYYNNFLGVYKWNYNKLTTVNQNELLPKINENEFLKEGKKVAGSDDILFKLPQKGKDIIVEYILEDEREVTKLKGNKIKLIWKGNHFEKSKPYF